MPSAHDDLQPSSHSLSHSSAVEPLTPLQIYFSFSGRVPRRIWWLYNLALLGLSMMIYMLLRIVGVTDDRAEGIGNLLLLWPALAVSVKRWHDRDKTGWWVWGNLFPPFWIWSFIQNGLLRGTRGVNRFGEDVTGRF